MSTNRYINTSFWDDSLIQNSDPCDKLIFLYLLTNTLTNIAGVYKIEKRRISFDTGYTQEVIDAVLKRFEAQKKIYYFEGYIIIKNFPKHQKWQDMPKIQKGIISILKTLPEKIMEFIETIEYSFPLELIEKIYISSEHRKHISGSTRLKIIERDNGCIICKTHENINIHHIKSVEHGGDNSENNLITLCEHCHIEVHKGYMDIQNYINLNSNINSNINSNTTETHTPKSNPEEKQDDSFDWVKIIRKWNSFKTLIPENELTFLNSHKLRWLYSILKPYSMPDILEAITNYDICLRSPKLYWFDSRQDIYTWIKNNFTKFLEANDPERTFARSRK